MTVIESMLLYLYCDNYCDGLLQLVGENGVDEKIAQEAEDLAIQRADDEDATTDSTLNATEESSDVEPAAKPKQERSASDRVCFVLPTSRSSCSGSIALTSNS